MDAYTRLVGINIMSLKSNRCKTFFSLILGGYVGEKMKKMGWDVLKNEMHALFVEENYVYNLPFGYTRNFLLVLS
jgi:hypothetical protein